jgi:hypothetical protein
MIADPLLSGQHVLTMYAYGVIAFGLRTFPQPKNTWLLWAMGVIQFAFMNLAEGKSNVDVVNAKP